VSQIVSDVTVVETNKRVVQRMFEEDLSEVDPARRAQVSAEIFAPDFYDPTNPPGMQHGLDGHRAVVSFFFSSFPSMKWRIESLVAEGDKVVVQTTMTGRHQGDFFGVSPTGIDVSVPGIHILTLRDGKIVLHEGVNDDLGLMRQLGVVPALA
jgi:predicted ester cyclase